MSTLSPSELWTLDALENGGHSVADTLFWLNACSDIEDGQQPAETENVRVISPNVGRRWRWRRH